MGSYRPYGLCLFDECLFFVFVLLFFFSTILYLQLFVNNVEMYKIISSKELSISISNMNHVVSDTQKMLTCNYSIYFCYSTAIYLISFKIIINIIRSNQVSKVKTVGYLFNTTLEGRGKNISCLIEIEVLI